MLRQQEIYNAINFNGNVVKCTACNDLYDPNPKGKLEKDGKISWVDNFDDKFSVTSYENERCLKCNKLPLCMGLCPREHFNGKSYCKDEVLDVSFEDSIINYIEREYENHK